MSRQYFVCEFDVRYKNIMKPLTFGFLFSLLFSIAACGHQSDGVLDLNGGAATASPATTNGIVNFTFPDMQNIDFKKLGCDNNTQQGSHSRSRKSHKSDLD